MTGLTAEQQSAIARIVETVVGLGVADVDGCGLCGRNLPCPVHVGIKAAEELTPALNDLIRRRVTEALTEAADAIEVEARRHMFAADNRMRAFKDRDEQYGAQVASENAARLIRRRIPN